MRKSFEQIYMKLALMLAERSTCARLQVGCVITSTDFRYVYGVGYNGNASGLDNKCDSAEPSKCGCLPAEENAIINCTVPRNYEKVVFCTSLPCPMCAKRIINLGGVKMVYFNKDYGDHDGLILLDRAYIERRQLSWE